MILKKAMINFVFKHRVIFFYANKILRTKYCRDIFSNIEDSSGQLRNFDFCETKMHSTAVRRLKIIYHRDFFPEGGLLPSLFNEGDDTSLPHCGFQQYFEAMRHVQRPKCIYTHGP